MIPFYFMSRSKKKPYITQRNHGHPADPKDKRQASRAVRSAKEIASGSAYKKVSNSWDICDWKFFDPKNKKASRK